MASCVHAVRTHWAQLKDPHRLCSFQLCLQLAPSVHSQAHVYIYTAQNVLMLHPVHLLRCCELTFSLVVFKLPSCLYSEASI